jgi:site-specific recombinase XerD
MHGRSRHRQCADRPRRRAPGTCEQYIKEGKGAIKWTRLSCRSFAANAVRLQFHALAYNLGNFMRTLAMPKTAEPWSLTMRATFITTALENGAQLEDVQKAAGHRDPGTTKLYDRRGYNPEKAASFFATY